MHIIQFFTRRQWVTLGLFLAVILAAYFNTWLSLGRRWNTRGEAYSHAFLLLLIALVLGLRHRHAFLAAPTRHGWLAIPLLLGASLVWMVGNLTQIGILQQIALPAIPLLAIWACVGFPAARTMLFPFAILYTVIPFWDVLVPHLQDLTVLVASALLATLGIPAFISEHYIQLPAGTLQVAEGCAGLSYLLISITLALIYAFQANMPWRRATLLLGLGILLGLATNWLRVFGIAIIAFYSEMKSSIVRDHELFGWLIFAGCLVPFFLMARTLEPSEIGAHAPEAVHKTGLPAENAPQFSLWRPMLVSGAAALLGPFLAYLLTTLPTQKVIVDLPDRLAGAIAQKDEASGQSWSPDYQGADTTLKKTYEVDGSTASVHLVAYLSQSQGKELISWGNQLVNTDQWKIMDDSKNAALQVTQIASRSGGVSYRIYSWYDIGGNFTNSDMRAKLLELAAILHRRKDASLVAIAFKCTSSPCAEQESQLAWVRAIQQSAQTDLILVRP